MSGLLYRPDMDQVRQRLTTWWNGGDIGRPAIRLNVPADEPLECIKALPTPPDWRTDYSTGNWEYRLNISARACTWQHYLAEAVPYVSPDLGPCCLALYLGCRAVEGTGTVWAEPCIDPDDPTSASFEYDPDNPYWKTTLRLGAEQRRIGQGKFLLQFPDLIEGLDALASMRGTERLLGDLVDRPDWVQDSLTRITQAYFKYYDILYEELMRDETGGSIFWCWAPGRMTKLQCDISAMIGPEMFRDFVVPVIRDICHGVDYAMYHWDGPGAICHHDHLLAIEGLDMLQWTPGAGAEPPHDRRWWPLYHKTIDAGKKVCILCKGIDNLRTLRREFGPKLKQFLIWSAAESIEEAEKVLEAVRF